MKRELPIKEREDPEQGKSHHPRYHHLPLINPLLPLNIGVIILSLSISNRRCSRIQVSAGLVHTAGRNRH